MASATPPVASTKETNFARLCRVLIDVGSQALRDTFDSIHAPANLQLALARHQPIMQSLRRRRIVNPLQWSKLYPVTPSSVSSASFDITLTVILLRNICGLIRPVTGWDTLPAPGDTSREADIARVKYFRNTIYGHAEQASVDDVTFNKHWQDIRDTLVRLGGVQYGVAIDTLKTECMDSDIEDYYKELLKQWKKDDDNIKDRLSEVETEMKKMKKQVDDLTSLVSPPKEDEYFPTDIVQKIRQGYIDDQLQSPPWCLEFNFHLESLFTKLATADRTESTGETIQLEDVFKAHRYGQQPPRTVVIEGKSGMGKTTYCQKLAYDWARKPEEEKFLPEVQVLLSMKCSDMSSDIWTAIDDQVLPEDTDDQSKQQFFKFIRENQSKVLLILDGLDELAPDKRQLVKRELPGCHFLLTTDQGTAQQKAVQGGSWLKIVGFTEQDARTFISKYFENQGHLANKLFEVLDKFDHLRTEVIPGNPVYTALLCLLCEDLNGVFPTSITQLYTEIVRCAIRRFEVNVKGKTSSGSDLIEVYKEQLTRLGLIAFNDQRKGDSDPEEEESPFNMGDLPEFGFISAQAASSTRRPRLWYGFKQYFAGFYLAYQIISSEMKVDTIIADQSYFNPQSGVLKQVLLYMSGILGLQSEEKALDLVESICSRINTLAVGNAEDIYEFQQLLLLALECREYDSEHKDNFNSKLGSSLKLETLALGSLIYNDSYRDLLKSNAFKSSWFRDNCYRGFRLLMIGLVSPFSESLKSNTTLSTLLLCHNEIESSGAEALSGALKVNSTLTILDLTGNKIGSSGAQALSDALQINTTLTKLNLGYNGIEAAGIQALSEALKSNATLTSLNLCRNKIGESRRQSLPNEVFGRYLGTITFLNHKSLPEALEMLATFSEMDETRNDFGLYSLSECLKINTTLANLNLAENGIDFVGAHYLAEGLKTNTGLITLDLTNNRIRGVGAECLCLSLKTNATLTTLNISFSCFSSQALAEVLQDSALKALDVSSNGMGNAGAQCIFKALAHNRTLTSLNASHNDIDAIGAQHISEALVQNHTLTYLDISHNPIGGTGALFLKDNTSLSKLDLTWSCTTREVIESKTPISRQLVYRNNRLPLRQLFNALKVNATLTSLKLSQNAIPWSASEDQDSVFEALTMNVTLKELELERMEGQVNFPAKILTTSSAALTHLNLSDNSLYNLRSIFEALEVNSTLTHLELRRVEADRESRRLIGDSECQFISETLKVNTTLTDLDLSFNSIGEVGIQCISEALKINQTLRYLELLGLGVPNWQPLWDALKVNTAVFVLL